MFFGLLLCCNFIVFEFFYKNPVPNITSFMFICSGTGICYGVMTFLFLYVLREQVLDQSSFLISCTCRGQLTPDTFSAQALKKSQDIDTLWLCYFFHSVLSGLSYSATYWKITCPNSVSYSLHDPHNHLNPYKFCKFERRKRSVLLTDYCLLFPGGHE